LHQLGQGHRVLVQDLVGSEREDLCPRASEKYEGYGDDSKLWSISIRASFNRVFNDTVIRIRNVAFAKVYDLIQDSNFLTLLQAKEMDHNAILMYIADRITVLEAYYMHVESWKAGSFKFG
jgi:hypothetical protein